MIIYNNQYIQSVTVTIYIFTHIYFKMKSLRAKKETPGVEKQETMA